MEREKSSQGSGLSVAGLIMLAVSFVITFLLKQCIFGLILAVVSAIFASAGYMEARRTGGQVKLTLSILIIALLGTIIHFAWIASGPNAGKSVDETEIVIDTSKQKEDESEKDKILEKLEEKAEQLEKEN